MYRVELPLEHILPIEVDVYEDRLAHFRDTLRSGIEVPDVLAVPLESQGGDLHFLTDGHHRGRAAHDIGQRALWASVFETDFEIAEWVSQEHPKWGFTTLASLRYRYLTEWLPRLSARATLADMEVIPSRHC